MTDIHEERIQRILFKRSERIGNDKANKMRAPIKKAIHVENGRTYVTDSFRLLSFRTQHPDDLITQHIPQDIDPDGTFYPTKTFERLMNDSITSDALTITVDVDEFKRMTAAAKALGNQITLRTKDGRFEASAITTPGNDSIPNIMITPIVFQEDSSRDIESITLDAKRLYDIAKTFQDVKAGRVSIHYRSNVQPLMFTLYRNFEDIRFMLSPLRVTVNHMESFATVLKKATAKK